MNNSEVSALQVLLYFQCTFSPRGEISLVHLHLAEGGDTESILRWSQDFLKG